PSRRRVESVPGPSCHPRSQTELEPSRQSFATTCFVASSMATGIRASGDGAGPAIGSAPRAGSNSAPWHGHTRSRLALSHCTGHPACVQIRLNASTAVGEVRSSTAGSPLPGAVNATAPPTGTLSSRAIGVPRTDEADDDGEARVEPSVPEGVVDARGADVARAGAGVPAAAVPTIPSTTVPTPTPAPRWNSRRTTKSGEA